MSRIGKKTIEIPQGVTVEIDGRNIKVRGPLGELSYRSVPGVMVEMKDNTITVRKTEETERSQKYWGLVRTLVDNMVIGVSKGFEKVLEINGVGFRAAIEGSAIVLTVGFSHPVKLDFPEGVKVAVEKNQIKVTGYDKEKVGAFAAKIRSIKKPEPYKGKGIKYVDEHVRRKQGKTAVKGA